MNNPDVNMLELQMEAEKRHLRLRCLELAVGKVNNPHTIVEDADKYFKFVMGVPSAIDQ